MKKNSIAFLIMLIFSTSVFAIGPIKFCFDGMCFDKKGWKNIQGGRELNTMTMTSVISGQSTKFFHGGKFTKVWFIIKKITPIEKISIDDYVEKRFYEQKTQYNNMLLHPDLFQFTIVEEGITPVIINNHQAKVFGLQTKGNLNEYKRIYIFEKDGYFFEIQTNSDSNIVNSIQHTQLFFKILSTFTFEP